MVLVRRLIKNFWISGAYEKVISNCKKLVNAGVRICLRTPILTFTLNEIEQMRQIADEMGVVFCTSFEISPTIDKDSTSQQYQVSVTDALAFEVKEYFEKENRTVYDARPKGDGTPINIFSCKMGRGALVIDYEGNMFPCMKFRHIGKKVCKDNFDELWASYNEYYTYTTKKDNKCNRCDANYYCEVCPAEMDFLYGDMEYRSEIACMIAKFRKALYEGELATYDIAVDRLDSLFKEGGEKDDIPKTNSKTDGS